MATDQQNVEKAGRLQPFKVARDGTITDRATGERIGFVRIIKGYWSGYLTGPDYPADPYQQWPVEPGLAGRRWSIAREVWREHLRRSASSSTPGQEDA